MNALTKERIEQTLACWKDFSVSDALAGDLEKDLAEERRKLSDLRERRLRAETARKQCIIAIEAMWKSPLAEDRVVSECCSALSREVEAQALAMRRLDEEIKEQENNLAGNSVLASWIALCLEAHAKYEDFLKADAARCKPHVRSLIHMLKLESSLLNEALVIMPKFAPSVCEAANNHKRLLNLAIGVLKAANECSDEEFMRRMDRVDEVLNSESGSRDAGKAEARDDQI